MIQKQYNCHLATPEEQTKHKGKWKCPQCGETRFVPFVDSDGIPILDANGRYYGKCERVNSCAYFASPKGKRLGGKYRTIYKQTPPPPPPTYIDDETFKDSLQNYNFNHLITYLNGVFGASVTDEMIAKYFIGSSSHFGGGSTIFWQRDRFGRIHRGKVMQYDPANGKRVKINSKGLVTSMHKLMKIDGNLPPECLFGEHLLSKYPNTFVGIVESEKTAIIASGVITDCLFLATGGCQGLKAELCQALKGRNVVLFPDNGKFNEWTEKGRKMRHIFKTISIVDIMEREDILKRYGLHDGDDIGDIILHPKFNIRDLKIDLIQL